MKNVCIIFLLGLFLSFTACKTSSSGSETPPSETEEVTGDPNSSNPINSIRSFMFGHSLLVHENTSEPTEEKKVPHWLYLLSQEASLDFTADGQYGFLRNHADFSTIQPQWGFQQAPSTWTDSEMPFSSVDFNTIISTPGNFIQYQGPDQPYYDDPNTTPLSATLDIYDQSHEAHPQSRFYIYENWPDMSSYGSFPDSVDFTAYNNATIEGDFHAWFIEYHDSLLNARPQSHIKMIPTGPIMSKLFRDTVLSGIPLTSLYEDDAPHGQPTLYFLASLVTYSALYQTPAPLSFTPPQTVHPLVRDNYSMIVNFIWTELNDFNTETGESRVF